MIDITIKRRAKKAPRIRIVRKKGHVPLRTRVWRAITNHRPRVTGFRAVNLKLPRIGFSD